MQYESKYDLLYTNSLDKRNEMCDNESSGGNVAYSEEMEERRFTAAPNIML